MKISKVKMVVQIGENDYREVFKQHSLRNNRE
jgi:hypothetical protein